MTGMVVYAELVCTVV